MLFNPEKALVAWNNDNLDTYHDIVVSFDYARYSSKNIPLGGFCVVFFESKQDVPTIGGPNASLGYTPSSQKDYCYRGGYQGFVGGFIGVGFDLNGDFGVKTDLVDGLEFPVPNSCTIRSSESENYKRIDTSKNLAFTPISFAIADKISSEDKIPFKSIRILISRAFTNIKVQAKNISDKDFVTIFETKIPIRRRSAVRVGIINTTVDTYTKFSLKNFNVAGFPGVVTDPELRDCSTIFTVNNIPGHTIVSSDTFCAIPIDGNVNVYEIRDGRFSLRQVLQEEQESYLLGGNDRFLFVNKKDTYDIEVYYRQNLTFLKTQTINMLDEIFDVPVNEIGGYPTCADTDSKFLAVGNKKNIYLWQFFTGISTFGVFGYSQTLANNVSGDVGYAVQVDNGKLLTSGGQPRLSGRRNSFVAYYEFNGLIWDEDPKQSFVSPITGNNVYNEFGYSITMQGNEAVIGSPNEGRRNRTTVGHGDAFHYVFARNRQTGRREWRSVMALGNFFNLNTPGGNFGSAVSMLGNNLLISAPYENYHFPPDKIFEDKPNTGRVYMFRKNSGGTFSQAAILAPDPFRVDSDSFRVKPYMLFGSYVGFIGRTAAIVAVPYNNIIVPSEFDVYKIGCIFDIPPEHLPINLASISLFDSGGYTIDIDSYTYLQLISDQTFL